MRRIPTVVRFIKTESRVVVPRGWGKGEMGTCCFVGTGFQLGKVKKFWRLVGCTIL